VGEGKWIKGVDRRVWEFEVQRGEGEGVGVGR